MAEIDLTGNVRPLRRPSDAEARMRVALDELTAADADLSASVGAAELLAQMAELVADHDAGRDERKRQLWGAVAEARAARKRAELARSGQDHQGPSAAMLARLRTLHQARLEAEDKARRKLAAPGAFRRFAEARRDEERALADAGFGSWDELEAAARGEGPEADTPPVVFDPEVLARAEAAWAAFEAEVPGQLPGTPEADALRNRAYRLLGAVVADDDLVPRLEERAANSERRRAAEVLLANALRDVGIEPQGNLERLAHAYLRAVTP
jgi:hypothetical protein